LHVSATKLVYLPAYIRYVNRQAGTNQIESPRVTIAIGIRKYTITSNVINAPI